MDGRTDEYADAADGTEKDLTLPASQRCEEAALHSHCCFRAWQGVMFTEES